ncbi:MULTISPECIES: YjgN family protein [unclassified Nitrospina]|uniref:YjgN family protein n=1 Tax=unclassified Nitrospina TaxID=2638683 RepID=UPI003F9B0AFD
MNHYISLNAWSGNDVNRAAFRLATMFALTQKEAGQVVKQVKKGIPWRFANPLDSQNAQNVNRYLSNQGFSVELIPIDGQESNSMVETANTVYGDDSPADDTGMDATGADTDLDDGFDDAPPADTAVDQTMVAEGPQKTYKVEFHGVGGELFRIMFVNSILTILTLGIYSFWAKTKVRKYTLDHTSFNKDYFTYHGTGAELFRGAAFFSLILILVGVGSAGLGMYLGPGSQEIVDPIVGLVILLLIPALMVGAYRYRLTRTSLRNIRFSFYGKRGQAMLNYFVGYMLTLFTVGLYYPFFLAKIKKFWIENSNFGNQAFHYTGQGKDLFGKFLLFVLLFPLTAGLNIPWWQAFLSRYNWSHTHFGSGSFKFTASGWEMFKLQFGNLLILVFTLGIGFAWVVCRRQQFLAKHLSFEGAIDMNRVIQDMQKSGAFSEGGLDALDIPLDFG